MKKVVIKVAISLVLLLSLHSINMGAETQMTEVQNRPIMKVDFVPFAIETFVPISMNDIEVKSIHTIWFTKEHPLMAKLRKALEAKATQKKIDNRVIRLKVEFVSDGNVFYVDQEGIVLKNDQKGFQISKKQQEEIEREILYFSGVVDIKESKRLGIN